LIINAMATAWVLVKQHRTSEDVKKIELATNSMMSARLEETRESSFARGAKSETDKTKAE
jgi:hypothetical protein